MRAIDVHGHFGLYDRGPSALIDNMMTGSIEVVRQRAQAVGVAYTVVSALRALIPYGGDVLGGNDEAREAAEKYEDVLFWTVIDPRLPETYRQAEEMLTHPRCKGIKIHPVSHEYEIRDHGAAIFEFAAQYNAVMLTHSGDPGSFPQDFVPFVNQYPGVRLILAHLGNDSQGNLTRQVYALKHARHDNVYIDTSSARSMFSGLIEWAVKEIGHDRLLFGTDTPLYFTASQKARVECAEIDETAKQAILWNNAARLLGLD
jgi:predicted TIM-barrel fold metal-dependent hydrolase